MRPWTAIWKDSSTGDRKSSIFQGHFDTGKAVDEFLCKHTDRQLEVLIPGVHENLYISVNGATIKRNALSEHDHGV